MNKEYRRHSIFFPLLVVAIGVLLLLRAMSILDDESYTTILKYWPVLLIISGLDGYFQRNGTVGPTILIGAGVIFLFGNLGYYDINLWSILFKFWPVLIIALGLDLLLGNRSVWHSLFGFILGVAILAALIWFSSGTYYSPASSNSKTIGQAAIEQKSAAITLSPKVGAIRVRGGAASDKLIQGTITTGSREEVIQEFTSNTNTFTLESNVASTSYPIPVGVSQSRWDLKLNDSIPIKLKSSLIVGEQTLDLCTLDIRELEIETAFGKNMITLPCETSSSAKIKLSFGELIITIPEGADVNIELDSGLTLVNLPAGYIREEDTIRPLETSSSTQKVNLKIEHPFGVLTLRTAVK